MSILKKVLASIGETLNPDEKKLRKRYEEKTKKTEEEIELIALMKKLRENAKKKNKNRNGPANDYKIPAIKEGDEYGIGVK